MTVDGREPAAACRCSAAARCARSTRWTPSHLLLVASDRVSAFDVVMREPIPRKGAVLTQISAFWFERLARGVPLALRHRADRGDPGARARARRRTRREIAGRAMLVRRTAPVPFECVVRGYLAGSAWAEYREPRHPRGRAAAGRARSRARRLDPPLFSPATKAESGHDENVTFAAHGRRRWARELAGRLRDASFAVYRAGRDHAAAPRHHHRRHQIRVRHRRPTARCCLIDELLTPDCSRFWPADRYAPGRSQPSFDKQPLRDYLAGAQGRRAAGTARRRRRRCRPRWSRPPAAATSRRSACSPGGSWRTRRDPDGAGGALVHRRGVGRWRWGCIGMAVRGRRAGGGSRRRVWGAAGGLGRRVLPRSRAGVVPGRPADRRAGRRQGRERDRGGRAGVPRRPRAADLDLHERVRLSREPLSDRRHGRLPALQPGRVRPRRRRRSRASSNEQSSVGLATRAGQGADPPDRRAGGPADRDRSRGRARRCTRASGWA